MGNAIEFIMSYWVEIASTLGVILAVIFLSRPIKRLIKRIFGRKPVEAFNAYVETKNMGLRRAKAHLQELEDKFKKDKAILIHLVHDLDSNLQSYDLVPAPNLISYHEAFEIIGAIRSAGRGAGKRDEIHLILHTLGGYSLPSFIIAEAIMKYKGVVTVYVPYVAMSGGTVIALAADKICMGNAARLGPVDSIYRGHSFSILKELRNLKEPPYIEDQILLNYLEAEKYEDYSKREILKITNEKHLQKSGQNIARELSAGTMSHGEGLDYEWLNACGMIVEDSCPELVYQITDAQIHVIKNRPTKAETLAKAKEQLSKGRGERAKRERS
jgi:ATP-dependent protease ClpP protease subunit